MTATVDDKLEYFSGADTCLMWALTELIATLTDDLNSQFGTVNGRMALTGDPQVVEELTEKLHDITILRDSNLPPRETTPLTNALCEGRR